MGRHAIPPGGQGEPSAVMVKRGEWLARAAWVDYRGGKHRSRGLGETKAEALADLDRVIAAARAVKDRDPRALTFQGLYDRWIVDAARSPRRGDSTIGQYEATWTGTLAPVLGDRVVAEAKRVDLQELLHGGLYRRDRKGNHLVDKQGRKIPLRGRQARNVLSQMLTYAADRGLVDVNVLQGTKPADQEEHADPRILTPEEWAWLRDRAKTAATKTARSTIDLHDVLVLMYATGVRIGEAVAPTWADVHLDAEPPYIRLHQALKEPRGKQVKKTEGIGPNKSRRGYNVRLSAEAVEMLRRRRRDALAKGHAGKTALVFATGKDGKPVAQANLRTRIRALVAGTDLEGFHSHDLRATFATDMERVHGVEAAGEAVNHADDGATAMRHYIVVDTQKVVDPSAVRSAGSGA